MGGLSGLSGLRGLSGLTAKPVVASGEDAIVTDWVSRTVTAGGSVSSSTRTILDTFVKGLKADGIWTKMSAGFILPLASNAFAGCLTPLIIPASRVITNSNFVSADYSLGTGLDPGAANGSKLLTSTILLSDLMTQTNAQVSAYQNLYRNSPAYTFFAGATRFGTPRLVFHATWSDGVYYWDCFDQGSGRLSRSNGGTGGLTSGSRISASASAIYRNGSVSASNSGSSSGFPGSSSLEMLFEDRSRYTYFYAGPALSASEEALHYARVQTMQTAFGRQV